MFSLRKLLKDMGRDTFIDHGLEYNHVIFLEGGLSVSVLKMCIPFDLIISMLEIYPSKLPAKACIHTERCLQKHRL